MQNIKTFDGKQFLYAAAQLTLTTILIKLTTLFLLSVVMEVDTDDTKKDIERLPAMLLILLCSAAGTAKAFTDKKILHSEGFVRYGEVFSLSWLFARQGPEFTATVAIFCTSLLESFSCTKAGPIRTEYEGSFWSKSRTCIMKHLGSLKI